MDLGIEQGSWAKWGAFTAPASNSTEPHAGATPMPASSTGGLAEALEASDRRIGLGPAGAVLTAVRDAATWEGAPRSGTVQFAITLYEGGDVAVALAGASDRAWGDVADHIAKVLKLRPPRLRSNRRGVRMVVELVAKDRMPDGSSPKSEGPRAELTMPIPRSTEESRADFKRRNLAAAPVPGAPADQRSFALIPDAPGVFITGRSGLGKASIGVGAFSEVGHGDPPKVVTGGLVMKGDFDVANLAGATRTISTRIVSEAAL